MHTVLLTHDLVGDCAWLANDSYAGDSFLRWLRPNPSTFPHSRRFYAQRLRTFLHSSGFHVRVMLSDDADRSLRPKLMNAAEIAACHIPLSSSEPPDLSPDEPVPEGTPLGFAAWSRRWSADERKNATGRIAAMQKDHWTNANSFLDRFETWAIFKTWQYERVFGIDRGMSKESFGALMSSMASMQGWFARTFAEHVPSGGWIYLTELVVDPKFQGNGVGRKLVQQGIDIANKERVPIGLVASDMGNPLYKKMGFKVVGHDMLRDEEGHPHEVMIYWPDGMEPASLKKFIVDKNGVREVDTL